jgi:hypothetical protein
VRKILFRLKIHYVDHSRQGQGSPAACFSDGYDNRPMGRCQWLWSSVCEVLDIGNGFRTLMAACNLKSNVVLKEDGDGNGEVNG